MLVAPAAASPFGSHHARLGSDLQGAVELEVPVGDNELTFR